MKKSPWNLHLISAESISHMFYLWEVSQSAVKACLWLNQDCGQAN